MNENEIKKIGEEFKQALEDCKDAPKFFMDQDNACHWYMIRADKRKDWQIWVELDETDEKSWHVPDYATQLSGSPKYIEFKIG